VGGAVIRSPIALISRIESIEHSDHLGNPAIRIDQLPAASTTLYCVGISWGASTISNRVDVVGHAQPSLRHFDCHVHSPTATDSQLVDRLVSKITKYVRPTRRTLIRFGCLVSMPSCQVPWA
jgi:hypothetical protein